MQSHQKSRIAIRYWLLGKGYTYASRAMNFAEQYHTGLRKDGVTPEFVHQITIAQYLRTLHGHLLFPDETFAVAFLHDVSEDYHVPVDEIRKRFNVQIADAVEAISKEFREAKKPNERYYEEMAANPIASVVKGGDRIHNLQSMVGVFTPAKQQSYIEEARSFTLPMLKQARLQFPEQEPIYENIKLVINNQIALIESLGLSKTDE